MATDINEAVSEIAVAREAAAHMESSPFNKALESDTWHRVSTDFNDLKVRLQSRATALQDALQRRDETEGETVPSDEKVRHNMEIAFENIAFSTTVGFLAGGVLGMVLGRRKTTRATFRGLGAGIGFGSSWTASNSLFKD